MCRVVGERSVVPLAVEVGGLDVEGGHLSIGDLHFLAIGVGIDPAGDGEADSGTGVGDQLDDYLMADQRLAAPVLGDECERAVLDGVSLAGSGWQMANGDGDPEFVG